MRGCRMMEVVVMATAGLIFMLGDSDATKGPGLSWCSESSIHNLRVDKAKKPELSNIEVLVNYTYEIEVVDEVYIRQQAPCEGFTEALVAPLDGDQARLVMQDDGEISLFWRPPDTIPLFQEVKDFCITAVRDSPQGPWTSFLGKFCFPTPELQIQNDVRSCSDVTCVRKCCPKGMAITHGAMCAKLLEGEDEWQPVLAPGEPGVVATEVHMLYGPPRLCDVALVYHDFTILPSGDLKLDNLVAGISGYCVDTTQGTSTATALVCNAGTVEWHCEWKHLVVKPVLLGVSCMCLVLTWLVYVIVPELRRTNEGSCIISLVSALFVSYLTLIHLNVLAGNSYSSLSCAIAGRLCHFTVLSAFFWMNVLSFHTFMQLRSGKDPRWERRLVFGLYSLYAWGSSFTLVMVGYVLDALQVDVIRPDIDLACWFQGAPAFWIYFYGPMVVLLLINVIFFVGCVTMLACGRGRKSYDIAPATPHSVSSWVYVKLFILMGILWIMEVITWSFFPYCSVMEWIFDVVNGLQGLYVFLVTVACRKGLKVFHCGLPRLVSTNRRLEGKTIASGEDTSEMAANPLVIK